MTEDNPYLSEPDIDFKKVTNLNYDQAKKEIGQLTEAIIIMIIVIMLKINRLSLTLPMINSFTVFRT